MSDLQTEGDVSAQLKKIAEHLVFIEKKLDSLIEAKKTNGGGQFSGAPRRYENNRPGFSGPPRHAGSQHGGPHGTRTAFYGPGGQQGGQRPSGGRPYRPNRFEKPGQSGGHGYKKFTPNRHSRHA